MNRDDWPYLDADGRPMPVTIGVDHGAIEGANQLGKSGQARAVLDALRDALEGRAGPYPVSPWMFEALNEAFGAESDLPTLEPEPKPNRAQRRAAAKKRR